MINVLLAAYCPDECFLKKQIASIRAQKGVEINLTVRDDLQREGACANFSALLDGAVKEMGDDDYIAFSDQDDVWTEDKLSRSLAEMRKMEQLWGRDTPILVFTDAKVVDADLQVLDESLFRRTKINPERILPRQLIMQNAANGNTMLLNAPLARKAAPIPRDAFMHDHWVMLVASAFGKISCINEPTVLYRQHDGNAIGGAKVGVGYYLRPLRHGVNMLRRRLYENIRQAEAFALRYSDAPRCFRVCVGFEKKNWLVRRWLLLRHGIFKNGFIRNIGMFLFV